MGFPTDVRDGCKAQLDALLDANPALLGGVHRNRPASFSLGLPEAYVGDLRTNLYQPSAGLRQYTQCEQDIVFVFDSWENAAQQVQADDLVDALLAAWPDNGHFVSGNGNIVGEPVRTRVAQELEVSGTSYPAVVVTIGRIGYLEAR